MVGNSLQNQGEEVNMTRRSLHICRSQSIGCGWKRLLFLPLVLSGRTHAEPQILILSFFLFGGGPHSAN